MENDRREAFEKIFIRSLLAGILLCLVVIPLVKRIVIRNTSFEWPDSGMATFIPKPVSNNGRITINNDNEFIVEVYKVKKTDFDHYTSSSKRFDWFKKSSDIYYSAYDSEGNILEVDYFSADRMMRIHVYESREAQILQGVEHYELEYDSYSDNLDLPEHRNYDPVIDKYTTPVKTTIYELKKDFPFDEASTYIKSIRPQSIDLKDEAEVWVYASYVDLSDSGDLKFSYDDLSIYSDGIEIKTHFDILDSRGPWTIYRIIVLSIIPVEQHNY